MSDIITFKTINSYNGYFYNGYFYNGNMSLYAKPVLTKLSITDFRKVVKLMTKDPESLEQNVRTLFEAADYIKSVSMNDALHKHINKKLDIVRQAITI